MKSKSQLNRKVQLAFGSALVTLLVVGAISYHSIVASSESDPWVRHSQEVLASLQDVLLAMRSVEASSRGFVLTGQETYSESSRASILRLGQEQAMVRDLTVDNPAQRSQLPTLARLAAEKVQLSEKVIACAAFRGLEAAADAIRNGLGQRGLDEFQDAVQNIQDEEVRLLVLRNTDVQLRMSRTKAVLTFGTVLGLLITATASWAVQRDSSSRGRHNRRSKTAKKNTGHCLTAILARARSRERSTAVCWKRLPMPWWW